MTSKKYNYRFSMIELLVVLSLFLFLTTLINPVLQKTLERSLFLGCKNNLKNVYAAMTIYTEDNSGFCPGPSWDGQVARIYGSKNQISEYLSEYLNVNNYEREVSYVVEMVCPSNKQISTSRSFFNRQNFVTYPIDNFGRPFGRPKEAKVPEDPKLMSQIPNLVSDLVIEEADYKNYPYSGRSTMPALPVHFNTTRNILFFDGHLEQELGL